jgi:hypothetical protein
VLAYVVGAPDGLLPLADAGAVAEWESLGDCCRRGDGFVSVHLPGPPGDCAPRALAALAALAGPLDCEEVVLPLDARGLAEPDALAGTAILARSMFASDEIYSLGELLHGE